MKGLHIVVGNYEAFTAQRVTSKFPIWPTGHRQEGYSPGGGSLDARLPSEVNEPPWGRGRSCRFRHILFGAIVYQISNLSFDGVGHRVQTPGTQPR